LTRQTRILTRLKSDCPFPYLYDFSLNALLYYYPDAGKPGHYTTNPRYFYNFATGQIITK
jgi:hypothetical protein